MSGRRSLALPAFVFLLAGLPASALAQLPGFVAGFGGGTFNTETNAPEGTSGGFAYQAQAGVRLAHVHFGAEFGSYTTARNAKSQIFGAFARFPSYIGQSEAQIFLGIGLGVYRFDPISGKHSTTAGGSIGPGVSIGLKGVPLAVLAEVRFHSTFDKLPRINGQEFIAALGGLELRF
ncbi:MAG TPA: hypothetical protein VG692_17440 [Gemmatimonadales bacterium]|nr:hypothetical protein [Gemmatimonadales bacterium]